MADNEDVSEILRAVSRNLSDTGVDWTKKQVDRFLGVSNGPLWGDSESPSSRHRRFAQLESKRHRESRKTSQWDWYQQLNPLPPLPPEETIRLAEIVEIGVLAQERLDLGKNGELEEIEVKELRYFSTRGRRAFEKLVVHNLRLVFHWARPYRDFVGTEDVQDAFQAGVFGLVKGLQKWDYRLGFTLATYVTSSIRQAIQRWRFNESLTIRIPVHVWQKLFDAGVFRKQAEEDLDDAAGFAELASSEEEVEAKQTIDVTLDAAIRAYNLESYETLSRGIPGQTGEEISESLEASFARRQVHAILYQIPEREAGVLRMRFGLGDGIPKTLEEVGDVLGVTRERARQIQVKAEQSFLISVLSFVTRDGEELFDMIGHKYGDDRFWRWLISSMEKSEASAKAPPDATEQLRIILKEFPDASEGLNL